MGAGDEIVAGKDGGRSRENVGADGGRNRAAIRQATPTPLKNNENMNANTKMNMLINNRGAINSSHSSSEIKDGMLPCM